MCHSYTTGNRGRLSSLILALVLLVLPAFSQAPSAPALPAPDWRQIGGVSFEASLASLATGPVDRVWHDEAGTGIYARSASGRIFFTGDYEHWTRSADSVEPPERPEYRSSDAQLPESGARILSPEPGAVYLHALGRAVYRSEDGGRSWTNLTEFRNESIVGYGLVDISVSPADEDEIVVAGRFGVWRSVDGGYSWSGLNDALANLPVRRISGTPAGGGGTRLILDGLGEFEWAPGEKSAWRPVGSELTLREEEMKRRLTAAVGEPVTAVASAGDFLYAGAASGRLWSSPDRGATWRLFAGGSSGPIARIFAVPNDPRAALAVAGGAQAGGEPGARVYKTANGGLFWDDLTGNLPGTAAHGVAADPVSGAVYVAADAGVFFTIADLRAASPEAGWIPVTGSLTGLPVLDVRLDDAGNQLYIAVEGEGVFAAMAPHRLLLPSVVNAADLRFRAAAPGVLLSVLGGEVQSASAGSLDVPILAATAGESQIQVPFEAGGAALPLALTTVLGAGDAQQITLGLPLLEAAPAIFVDRDGSPMVLDADSGVLLDAMNPARPGARLQILATGLGKVDPAWPSGMPAPIDDPPSVIAPVRIFLDRAPLEAARATLAPGYVGFYLIEFVVPDIVNAGPAELYVEAGSASSNRTRIYLEP